MRRRKSGVGAELAPLVLILACLAGSLGSIVAVYRRVNVARTTPAQPPVLTIAPVPVEVPIKPRPGVEVVSIPAPKPVEPALPPVDPTPKVLAGLTAAEAEQLLEASKANRKAQALEAARQAAVAESERWRRRQSLIHAQIDTLESKVRKVEVNLDQMALERDALQRELDARKAAVERAKSRPSQAILPHKGPNGTWRRPIIVECRNGAAIIQPQGVEFGLHDLESGFGPTSSRFVSAIAREAVRVQRQASPDGAPVVPYVFFLVRPDGIRPYYEARGRLEPLGVTFGYELADADWEVEFPNLDEVATWDGSMPSSGSSFSPALARTQRSRDAENTDLPIWPSARPGGDGPGGNDPDPFTFSPRRMAGGAGSRLSSFMGRPLNPSGVAGSGLNGSPGGPSGGGIGPGSEPATSLGRPVGGMRCEPVLADGAGPGRQDSGDRLEGSIGPRVTASGRIIPATPGRVLDRRGGGPGNPSGMGGPLGEDLTSSPGGAKPGIEIALDGPTADSRSVQPGQSEGNAGTLPSSTPANLEPPGELALSGPVADPTVGDAGRPDPTDPGSDFVWTGPRDRAGQGRPVDDFGEPPLGLPTTNLDRSERSDDVASAGSPGSGRIERANPGASGGEQAAKRMFGSPPPGGLRTANPPSNVPPVPGAMGVGLPSAPMPPRPLPSASSLPNLAWALPSMSSVPPLAMDLSLPPHPPTHEEIAEAVRRQTSPNAPPPLMPTLPTLDRPGSIVDRTFEVVVVCNPQGVIIQPGTYRITAEALRDREGLFKKEVVALVKARRAANPMIQIEPKIRFLIQPNGYPTYQAARSQFFVSGLTWPTTTELATPDPLAITTSGVR